MDEGHEIGFYFIVFHLVGTWEGVDVRIMLGEDILTVSPVGVFFAKETVTVFFVEFGHMVELVGFHGLVCLVHFRSDGIALDAVLTIDDELVLAYLDIDIFGQIQCRIDADAFISVELLGIESALTATDDEVRLFSFTQVAQHAYTLIGIGWTIGGKQLPVFRQIFQDADGCAAISC